MLIPRDLDSGVLATIKAEKKQIDTNNDGKVDYYEPILTTATDYYPFGMPMPGRTLSLNSSSYRFCYQGSEKDNEIYGDGNTITTHYRFEDIRLGRWFSTDPKAQEMPWQSPYNSMNNNPILLNDVLGDLPGGSNDQVKKKEDGNVPKKTSLTLKERIFLSLYFLGKQKLDEKEQKGELRYHLELGTQMLIDQAVSISTDKVFNPVISKYSNVQYSVVASESYIVNQNKFNYFFGKVISGSVHNIQRSAQNLKDLTTLGIKNETQLRAVFSLAIKNGTVISTKTSEFGTTVMRRVNVGNKGSIDVGFFYAKGNMNTTPTISTLIPKIFNK